MKIALVITTFPPHVGGMGQVAADEARILSERGFDVTVFTLSYPHTDYCDDSIPYKVTRLRPLIKLGDAGFTPQLCAALRQYDVVHLHYPGYGMAEAVLFSAWLFRVKYFVTYHMNAVPTGVLSRLAKYILDKLFLNAILKKALKIITPDKEYYAFETGLDNALEVYNGVDPDLYAPASKKEIGHATDKGLRELLFVGNLMPVKRLDLLLKALQELRAESVHLTVAGGGYEIDRYQTLARELGVENMVTWLGSITVKELPPVFQKTEVVVVPSERESFSLVTVMAMSSGVPVVAADVCGLRGRIQDGVDGLLFRSGDVSDLVFKLKSILSLDQVELANMGKSGRSKVLEKYTLSRYGDKIEKIIQELL